MKNNEYSLEITEKFVTRYNDFDLLKDDEKVVSVLVPFRDRINDLRKIRNLAVHASRNGEKPFLVSKALLDELEHILSLVQNKVSDISTNFDNLLIAREGNHVYKVIEVMNEFNYSFVPVVDNDNAVLGIFTEKNAINIMCKFEMSECKRLLVKDIIDLLSIDNSDEFFLFCTNDEFLHPLKDSLLKGKDGKRFGACFITKNGQRNNPLLSMFTTWDLLNK